MTHDVFISYSFQDQKIVEGLSAFLEENGIRCFIAYRDIPRGVVWAAAITEAIEQSKMMVVVFSDSFNKSPQVDREIELCAEEKKPILTFRITEHDFIGAKKYYLKNLNWIDAFPDPKKSFGFLHDSISKLISTDQIGHKANKSRDLNLNNEASDNYETLRIKTENISNEMSIHEKYPGLNFLEMSKSKISYYVSFSRIIAFVLISLASGFLTLLISMFFELGNTIYGFSFFLPILITYYIFNYVNKNRTKIIRESLSKKAEYIEDNNSRIKRIIKNDLFGLVDVFEPKYYLMPSYQYISHLGFDLWVIRQNNIEGIYSVDKSRIIITPRFNKIYTFQNGKSKAILDGKEYSIDKFGNINN